MIDKYGPEKGKQVYYAWLNKHGYDDTKPFPKGEGLKEADIPKKLGTGGYACKVKDEWKLPIHDAAHVRNAMARYNQAEGCQTSEVKARICAAAKHFGIDGAFEEGGFCYTKKGTEAQIPEQPVNTVASEPAPMTPSPLPQQEKPVQVNSIGAVSDSKGPLGTEPKKGNPDKNLGAEPIKEQLGDKDKVKIGKQPEVGIGTPLIESTTDKPKEEPKKEEPVKKEESKPVVPLLPSSPASTKEPNKPVESKAVEQPKPEDRIKELEGVVTKLQENVKKLEADRNKVIKEAIEKTKKELIDKIKEALPSENIISNFNRGGRILATDIKKVIYEAEATKE
jgi:hypothetical protein